MQNLLACILRVFEHICTGICEDMHKHRQGNLCFRDVGSQLPESSIVKVWVGIVQVILNIHWVVTKLPISIVYVDLKCQHILLFQTHKWISDFVILRCCGGCDIHCLGGREIYRQQRSPASARITTSRCECVERS